MEIITSVKNPLIVQTKKIKNNPKNEMFLENIKVIGEVVKKGIKVKYFLILKEKLENMLKTYDFLSKNIYYVVSGNVLKSLCDTVSPQGIVAVIDYEPSKLSAPKGNFLVLENLQDAGNVGTIIRSSCGTDFEDIYLIDCVDFRNQKVVRSSMGGIFSRNLFRLNTTEEFLEFKRKNNLNLITATMEGENLFSCKVTNGHFGIVIGNEGNGVSNLLKENSFKQVSIPMKNGLESLNAGVSCSIIMYYLDNLKK